MGNRAADLRRSVLMTLYSDKITAATASERRGGCKGRSWSSQSSLESVLSFHFIVRFNPLPGMEERFREELLRVNGPSREEIGCIRIDIFETIREPVEFAIHSEWTDEAAFELHTTLPHTVRFIAAAEELLSHPIKGLRMSQIGGGVARAFERA